ncbi:hypothetical protein A1Q2_08330 [Trichosporon asahii var. asahii CBS 8904]|uniref:Helicase ATP-binding domain-containing protein n=1 Tax=Trichosporon asahii var. asahii (strain CBS 8904) TaxID=1220162 RepID=K1VKW5_TRIAC|nr:hypothetical protein A1Q2_08330 [Trichosporon asahii var. asahii CBS 8904]
MRKAQRRPSKAKVKVNAEGKIVRPDKPKLKSERSPHDFDEEAEADAQYYVGDRDDERKWRERKEERDKVKAENARRRKRGEDPLPLPTVPSRKKLRRARDALRKPPKPQSHDSDSEGGELPGVLGFNPLPILAAKPHEVFSVETIVLGHNGNVSVQSSMSETSRFDHKVKAQPCPPLKDETATPPDVAHHPPHLEDVKPGLLADVKRVFPEDVKPRVSEDIKPQMPQDTKPRIPVDMKPRMTEETSLAHAETGEDEGEEDSYEDDGLVPTYSISADTKPHVSAYKDMKPTAAELRNVKEDSADEEEGEEEYDDDDFVMAPRSGLSLSGPLIVKQEVEAMQAEDTDEEEEYEEEDWIQDTFSSAAAQAAIGPFKLDPEDPGIVIPKSINRFLRDYQRVGAAFLYRKYKQGHGGVLGDDMGLGKTIQVISFLSAIMRKTGTSTDYWRRKIAIRHGSGNGIPPQQWPTALIVCPKSLLFNVSGTAFGKADDTVGARAGHGREVWKQMEQGYLDIVLVSHALVGQLRGLPFSTVIVDEAHKMKRPDSRLAFAAKSISARACFALTGTLVQNRIEELWSVLDFVRRGWAGTQQEWKDYAVNPINYGHKFDGSLKDMVNAVVSGSEDIVLTFRNADKRLIAHEMPSKRDMPLLCPLGSRQAELYQRVVDSNGKISSCHAYNAEVQYLINHDARDKHFDSVLGPDPSFHAFGRISNHCCTKTGDIYDPEKDKSEEAIYEARMGRIDSQVLVNLLEEWHSDREERNKVLIFSTSVRLLKMIRKFIEVNQMVDKFQDPEQDLFIMLVSTLAGGVGLNLTAVRVLSTFKPTDAKANKVVIFDPSWIYKQQRARQLNYGTFEARMYTGVEGSPLEKGELFGLKNIFRYRPEGFVVQNLERVRLTEEQVRADLLAAEHEEESDDDEERRDKEAKRMMIQARDDSALLSELASDGDPTTDPEERLLEELDMRHDDAFKDSPEEKKIFEIGLQILAMNPELAKSIKANDAAKHRPRLPKRATQGIKLEPELEEDPWKKRLEKLEREKKENRGRERVKQLVDEEDMDD